MKLKAILTTAMLIASMTAAALPASADNVSSAAAVTTGREIAAANGIVLDSDADAAELAVLNRINDGMLPEIDFDDDSTVSRINGLISDRTVRSVRDAKAVIASIADLLGISAVDTELTFYKENETDFNTTYIFRQVCQGVELENIYVALSVNSRTGKADYLNSGFIPGFSIDTAPELTPGQVRTIVRKAYSTGLQEDAKLVIFEQTDGTMKLAYEAKTNSAEYPKVFVDAKDGSILFVPQEASGAVPTYTYKSTTPNPVTKLTYFQINTEAYKKPIGSNQYTFYRLHDTERNIWILSNGKLDSFIEMADRTQTAWDNNPNNRYCSLLDRQRILDTIRDIVFDGYMTCMGANNFDYVPLESGMMYQAERVYDFYKNALRRSGTDGLNGRLFIYPYLDDQNAYAYGGYNLLAFGTEDGTYYHWASELDVVAHEYTHRVTDCIVGWLGSGWNGINSSGETSSLDEGYSDIMGEYASEYCGCGSDWKSMNKLRKRFSPYQPEFGRDASYSGPLQEGGYYVDTYFDWHFYKAGFKPSLIECHEGATIISHVAYLMDRYGISKEMGRKIWYRSMSYLPQGHDNAKFISCRNAVERAAQDIGYEYYPNSASARKALLVKVNSAFNYARIFNSGYKLGDINGDGYVNSSDVTLIAACARDDSRVSSPSRLSMGDVNFDGRITTADAEKLQRYLIYGGELDTMS